MGYYDQAFGNIANEGAKTVKTAVSAYVAGKHLANQKAANLAAAQSTIAGLETEQKVNNLELSQTEKEFATASENLTSKENMFKSAEDDLKGKQNTYDQTQKMANWYDEEGQRIYEESKSERGRSKGKFREEAENMWNERNSLRESLKEKGYDISKAREALDNITQDRNAALDMRNRIETRREALKLRGSELSLRLDSEREKYKKLGGK